jgi:immunoglobulin-binding protein 1
VLQANERELEQIQAQLAKARIQAAKTADQIEDEDTEKQRAWDDWKDDHPTGYGNSKLRPCAL